ncbi:MAG: Type II secretion system protein E [Firmicutes bacterium]|nr:Type II secretion system protein E [Bacillota bacterium]
MRNKPRGLAEILLTEGLIEAEALREALKEEKRTKETLHQILTRNGTVSPENLCKALSLQFNLKIVSLSTIKVEEGIISQIPQSMARRHKMFPIEKKDNTITVAISEPGSLPALDNLRVLLGCEIEPALTTEKEINTALDNYYGSDRYLAQVTIGKSEDEEYADAIDTTAVEGEDTPVIRLVGLILMEALRKRASDIHLEPLKDRFRVRYRIDGICQEVLGPPKELQGLIISRIKIMAGINIAEKRLPQDGRIRIKLLEKEIDLRVSTLPGLHGESVVMRILDKATLLIDLRKLGFSVQDQRKLESLITLPHGILLVTGPTGSGKTTTLYAVLNRINQPDRKLITVEEPVEYQLSGINQSQVRPEIDLTFAKILREILRQAPDIIMVGEIRDAETAQIAVSAALTGHLIFSTLHTNDAPGAMTRLINMGITPFLVASSVQGIIAQRLMRKICSNCSEPYTPAPHELMEIGLSLDDISNQEFFRGRGCHRCNQSGYHGRIAIFEMLPVTDEIRNLVIHNVPSTEIKQKARELGMKTLREDGWEKVFSGITTTTEVARVTGSDIE